MDWALGGRVLAKIEVLIFPGLSRSRIRYKHGGRLREITTLACYRNNPPFATSQVKGSRCTICWRQIIVVVTRIVDAIL